MNMAFSRSFFFKKEKPGNLHTGAVEQNAHTWPTFMALLTISTESALTEAGNFTGKRGILAYGVLTPHY